MGNVGNVRWEWEFPLTPNSHCGKQIWSHFPTRGGLGWVRERELRVGSDTLGGGLTGGIGQGLVGPQDRLCIDIRHRIGSSSVLYSVIGTVIISKCSRFDAVVVCVVW